MNYSEYCETFQRPPLREPTKKEAIDLGIVSMRHSFQCLNEIWTTAVTKDTCTYRVFYCGTNCMKILIYTPKDDSWTNASIDRMSYNDLHCILWRMLAKLDHYKGKETLSRRTQEEKRDEE